ncbi:MAG: hypothetical protein KAG61_06680 [Bacteriovoracaceae bacterium]|nr:hypothetical protein [Bacteriovoracaceae bacterium]
MNLQFKALAITFLICTYSRASEVVLITHTREIGPANKIAKIIEETRKIPKSFITIRDTKLPCQKVKASIVHLCIKNGEMRLVSINRAVVLGILKEFKKES